MKPAKMLLNDIEYLTREHKLEVDYLKRIQKREAERHKEQVERLKAEMQKHRNVIKILLESY